MADFSQMIYGTADNTTKSVGQGLNESAQAGVGLAMKAEELGLNRMKLQQAQQQLMNTKLDKFHDVLLKVNEFKDPSAKNNYLKNYMPKMVEQYGLQQVITPSALQTLAASDENQGRAMTLQRMRASGEISNEQYTEILNDDAKLALIKPTPVFAQDEKPLTNDESIKMAQDRTLKREEMQTQLRKESMQVSESQRKQATEIAATGGQALDRKMAEDSLTYANQGGRAEGQKNMAQVNSVLAAINQGKVGRSYVAKIPFVGGTLQDVFSPEVSDAQNKVRNAVNGVLRQTLGAQFTEAEGERIFSQFFNPAMPIEKQKESVGRLSQILQAQLQAKDAAVKYFNQNKTMAGYNAPMPDLEDFMSKEQIQKQRKEAEQANPARAKEQKQAAPSPVNPMPGSPAPQPQTAGVSGQSNVASAQSLADPVKKQAVLATVTKHPKLLPQIAAQLGMSPDQLLKELQKGGQ